MNNHSPSRADRLDVIARDAAEIERLVAGVARLLEPVAHPLSVLARG